MGKIFNLDAPVVQAVGKVGQMMVTTVTWLLFCLPIFTAGAATAAMCRMMFNLKEDRSCAFKDFFRAFRENFRRGTALWLILLACVAVLAVGFYLVVLLENTVLRLAALMLFCIVFFLVYIAAIYAFPLTAYFDNTVAATLRNAIGMGLSNLRQTIYAIAITMLPLVLMLVSMQLFLTLLFLLLIQCRLNLFSHIHSHFQSFALAVDRELDLLAYGSGTHIVDQFGAGHSLAIHGGDHITFLQTCPGGRAILRNRLNCCTGGDAIGLGFRGNIQNTDANVRL